LSKNERAKNGRSKLKNTDQLNELAFTPGASWELVKCFVNYEVYTSCYSTIIKGGISAYHIPIHSYIIRTGMYYLIIRQ